MRILWLSKTALGSDSINVKLSETLLALQQEKIHSTLLYQDPALVDHRFLQAFDAAFPHLLFEKQIAEIQPDLICSCYPIEINVPKLDFHPSETIQEILKQNKACHWKQQRQTPTFREKLTVLIRTKEASTTIEQTLKSLFSQNIHPSQFTIEVVDSESKDHTLEIVRSYGITQIHKIAKEAYFPGKILNQMIQRISSDIVIFLNSDAVLLTPTALECLLRPLLNKKIIASFARQIPRPEAHPWVLRDYSIAYPSQKPAPIWLPFSLCFAAMQRKGWEIYPFYSEAWGSEDIEWAVRVMKSGHRIEYVPEAVVMHSHNYTYKQLYGRRFIEGEADAFIEQRSKGFLQTVCSWIKSVINDTLFYIKKRKFRWMHQIIPLRFVYHWAYYQGHRWGTWRKQNQSSDTVTGQHEVLSRYDD